MSSAINSTDAISMKNYLIDSLSQLSTITPTLGRKFIDGHHADNHLISYLCFIQNNQAVKHLNGKMNLLGIMKFMYYRHVKNIDVALGQLFGVTPEFQGKGVEAAMIKRFTERIIEQGRCYKYLELNWLGEFNPPMIHLMEYIGASVARTHITYRKLFRDDIEFVRSVDKMKE